MFFKNLGDEDMYLLIKAALAMPTIIAFFLIDLCESLTIVKKLPISIFVYKSISISLSSKVCAYITGTFLCIAHKT